MLDLYINIKNLRIQKSWTQSELAKRVGYSDKSMIAKIEAGKIDLPLTKIKDFAEVFGVSSMYLMGWEEPEETASTDLAATLLDESDPILTELADVYSKLTIDKREQLLKIANALL